jgi:hypothetical protein
VVFSAFVNHIKYRLPGDIEDINNNREIKAYVISWVKSKLSKGYSILLIVFIILYEVF